MAEIATVEVTDSSQTVVAEQFLLKIYPLLIDQSPYATANEAEYLYEFATYAKRSCA